MDVGVGDGVVDVGVCRRWREDVGVCDGVGVGDGVVCAGVDVGDDRWRGVPSARSRTTLEPALSMLAVSVRSSQHSVI